MVDALRERGGRTLTRSFRLEAKGEGFAKERVLSSSRVTADDLRHWDVLASSFALGRIVIEVFARGCTPRHRPSPLPPLIRIDTS